jgi:glycosyltransferase involved in cell wall biosynthesis
MSSEFRSHSGIDIVIATRNSDRFLGECLTSACRQSAPIASVTIVDAASTDRTLEIASLFERVSVVAQLGVGLANAWNQGIRSSHGDFVALIDSDDIWEPTFLQDALSALLREMDALCVVAETKFFLDAEHVPQGFRSELLGSQRIGWMPGATLFRREVFDVLGLFPEEYSISSDIEWFARLRDRQIPLTLMHKVGLNKRIHGGNLSLTSGVSHTYHKELLRIARNRVKGDPEAFS